MSEPLARNSLDQMDYTCSLTNSAFCRGPEQRTKDSSIAVSSVVSFEESKGLMTGVVVMYVVYCRKWSEMGQCSPYPGSLHV